MHVVLKRASERASISIRSLEVWDGVDLGSVSDVRTPYLSMIIRCDADAVGDKPKAWRLWKISIVHRGAHDAVHEPPQLSRASDPSL